MRRPHAIKPSEQHNPNFITHFPSFFLSFCGQNKSPSWRETTSQDYFCTYFINNIKLFICQNWRFVQADVKSLCASYTKTVSKRLGPTKKYVSYMLFYNGQWIHWSRREDEALKPGSWENEQGKCTMKSMDDKNKFGLKTFEEYVNIFSYNCYLNREIHIICGEHNTTTFSEISAHYTHFCFALFCCFWFCLFSKMNYHINVLEQLTGCILFFWGSIFLTLTPSLVIVRKHLKHGVLAV